MGISRDIRFRSAALGINKDVARLSIHRHSQQHPGTSRSTRERQHCQVTVADPGGGVQGVRTPPPLGHDVGFLKLPPPLFCL